MMVYVVLAGVLCFEIYYNYNNCMYCLNEVGRVYEQIIFNGKVGFIKAIIVFGVFITALNYIDLLHNNTWKGCE